MTEHNDAIEAAAQKAATFFDGVSFPNECCPNRESCSCEDRLPQRIADAIRALKREPVPPTDTPDQRPKKGMWAPGSYQCWCLKCGNIFVGDKRALTCADCAYAAPPVTADVAEVLGRMDAGAQQERSCGYMVRATDYEDAASTIRALVAEVARLNSREPLANVRLSEENDALIVERDALRAERDAAVSFIRTVGDELVLADMPAGDRDVILANMRGMIAALSGDPASPPPVAMQEDPYGGSALMAEMDFATTSPLAAPALPSEEDIAEAITWALCAYAGGGGKGKCEPFDNCVCGGEGRACAPAVLALIGGKA